MPKEIRPVDVNVKGREPRKLGRMEGPGLTAAETIQPHQRPGRDVHGIDRSNVHGGGSAGYNDPSSEAHRASLRDSRK